MSKKNLSDDVLGLLFNNSHERNSQPHPINPSFRKIYRNAHPHQKKQLILPFQGIHLEAKLTPDELTTESCQLSSYQLYKRKQKVQKEKLNMVRKNINYQFYSTLRQQQSRSFRRRDKINALDITLPMRSVKSEIHNRRTTNRESPKGLEQCKILPGRIKENKSYSLQIRKKMNHKDFAIHKKKFPTYRPWSPSQEEQIENEQGLLDCQTII